MAESTLGESRELAARPLFGEYALYIPAASLAVIDATGTASGNGLRLNEVDDVLLRVEYVSVSR